ncbi:MAG: DJ-1/PfpI family protein [Proteobacteria bacterium]|nr:DJ-1/PfpI family protein [Pseudomonadota bacterium]
MRNRTTVGIFIFDEVEVLDFAGPFEVFSRTRLIPGLDSRHSDQSAPFTVFTVAEQVEPVEATGGLWVIPAHAFSSAPPIDILVVPGGWGTRRLLEHARSIGWLRTAAASAKLVTSVCSGALLLARAELLRNKRATTHWGALDSLATLDPTIDVQRSARVVQDGIITSAGISAGIDMALAVVELLHGRDVADDTAAYMEYVRAKSAERTLQP